MDAMLSFPEVNELSDDVRKVFEELDRRHDPACATCTGVYTPALDVMETAESVEVLVDLPGVGADGVRVLLKHGALVIAGEKASPEPCSSDHAFHLVERGFGRFARVIRLAIPVDARGTRASLRAGELRVTIPRINERRGEEILVTVETAGP